MEFTTMHLESFKDMKNLFTPNNTNITCHTFEAAVREDRKKNHKNPEEKNLSHFSP